MDEEEIPPRYHIENNTGEGGPNPTLYPLAILDRELNDRAVAFASNQAQAERYVTQLTEFGKIEVP